MKQVFLLTFSIVILAQAKAQPAPAIDLANKIADKLRDSIALSQGQRDQVYTVNLLLFHQKQQARTQSSDRDSVEVKLQGIENTRDSLYYGFFTAQQFELYRQKKHYLLRN